VERLAARGLRLEHWSRTPPTLTWGQVG
jgi:hypothetical protein